MVVVDGMECGDYEKTKTLFSSNLTSQRRSLQTMVSCTLVSVVFSPPPPKRYNLPVVVEGGYLPAFMVQSFPDQLDQFDQSDHSDNPTNDYLTIRLTIFYGILSTYHLILKEHAYAGFDI